MHVAVGERQRAQPFGMMGGEDLRDRAAAVVRHEVDLLDAERVEELDDHPRLRRERDILRRRDLGVAEPHQVERDAAPATPQFAR